MFTGIVEWLGVVAAVRPASPGVRLMVRAGEIATGTSIGDSIAVNGCCLTVIAIEADQLSFDAGPETLRRTNLGRLAADSPVNLERSLRVGDRLGGHFVSGHIDTTAMVKSRQDEKDWAEFWFQLPPEFTRQMVSKGSVAVDGVSLTLVEVGTDRFSVALIPHTLQVTTLGRLQPGDTVNIETDLLAKYAQKAVLDTAAAVA